MAMEMVEVVKCQMLKDIISRARNKFWHGFNEPTQILRAEKLNKSLLLQLAHKVVNNRIGRHSQ